MADLPAELLLTAAVQMLPFLAICAASIGWFLARGLRPVEVAALVLIVAVSA